MSNMDINQVLAQIRAISAQAQRPQAPKPAELGALGGVGGAGGVGGSGGPAAVTPTDGFANVLKRGIEQVNATQQNAASLATAFEKGVPGVELPQVMLEMQKASVSFRAVTEVRNRFVAAYQEVMNMPI